MSWEIETFAEEIIVVVVVDVDVDRVVCSTHKSQKPAINRKADFTIGA